LGWVYHSEEDVVQVMEVEQSTPSGIDLTQLSSITAQMISLNS
jgi:hypothetical protein